MLIIHVTYRMKPGMSGEFLERIWANGIDEASRKEPGCIRYDYYLPAESGDEILLLEVWENAQAQEKHMHQPHFLQLKAMKDQYVLETILERYESTKA